MTVALNHNAWFVPAVIDFALNLDFLAMKD